MGAKTGSRLRLIILQTQTETNAGPGAVDKSFYASSGVEVSWEGSCSWRVDCAEEDRDVLVHELRQRWFGGGDGQVESMGGRDGIERESNAKPW
jgi:hypothetical protein